MFRSLLLTALLATSAATAAQAQTSGGPPIAYVKTGGSAHDIYLANPSGTGTVRIYRGSKLGAIDLKPGGNQIAFTESGKLRILSYDGAGRQLSLTAPRSFGCSSTAQADRMDYHPGSTGWPLLVADACGHLWTMSGPTATPQLLVTAPWITNPRWLPDGSGFVYTTGGLDIPVQFWRETYPLSGAPTLLGPMANVPVVNMAHHANEAIIADLDGFYHWNVDTGVKRDGCLPARNAQLSPTGSQMVYRTHYAKSGEYILLKNADCLGGVTTVGAKGSYSVEIDWRK